MGKTTTRVLAVLIALLPLVYLAFIWRSLPQTIPTHFGVDLRPDKTGDKESLWVVSGIFAFASLLSVGFLTNIHRLDPKRLAGSLSPVFGKLALGLVVFLAAINGLLIRMAADGGTSGRMLLFPLLGLLLAFLGSTFSQLQPNYFAGIRLPWTLSSDENWRHTHALAGRVWLVGGLLTAFVCFFLSPTAAFAFFLAAAAVMVAVPVVASYRFFRRRQ